MLSVLFSVVFCFVQAATRSNEARQSRYGKPSTFSYACNNHSFFFVVFDMARMIIYLFAHAPRLSPSGMTCMRTNSSWLCTLCLLQRFLLTEPHRLSGFLKIWLRESDVICSAQYSFAFSFRLVKFTHTRLGLSLCLLSVYVISFSYSLPLTHTIKDQSFTVIRALHICVNSFVFKTENTMGTYKAVDCSCVRASASHSFARNVFREAVLAGCSIGSNTMVSFLKQRKNLRSRQTHTKSLKQTDLLCCFRMWCSLKACQRRSRSTPFLLWVSISLTS